MEDVRVLFEDGVWYAGTLRKKQRIGALTRIDYDDGDVDYVDVQAEMDAGKMKKFRRAAPPAAAPQPKPPPPRPPPREPPPKPPHRSLVESCCRKRARPYVNVGMLNTRPKK